MKLITLDEDGYPMFNPECRMIKEFNTIITRDKGSKGDAQARKKSMATKELAFVHFSTYYGSEFITSYSEDERVSKIVKKLELPDGWKPDAVIQLAQIAYKELIETPSMDSLIEVRESLFSANKIIKILRRKLESKLQTLDSQLTGMGSDDEEKALQEMADKVTKDYEKIMDIAKRMPDTLDTVNKLEERVKKEMLADSKGRGKSDINMQEIAD